MNTLQKCLLPIACLLIGIIVGAALLIILGLRPLGGSGGTPKEPLGPGNASTSSLPQAEKHQAELGRDAWKIPGKQWRLLVKKYSDASNVESAAPIPGEVAGGKPEVQAEFTMIVQTRPLRHRGDHDIARFQFIPSDKTPKHLIGQKFVLDIDVQTEQAVELHPSDPISFPVRTFGEDRYLRTQLPFPVDWMIRKADVVAVPQAEKSYTVPYPNQRGEFVKTLEPTMVPSRLLGTSAKVQQAVRVELSMRGAPQYRLVQTWVPGEPWWRSFQRFEGGYLDLEAFWLGEEPGKP